MAVSGRLVQNKDISLAAYIIIQYRLRYVFYANQVPSCGAAPYLIN